MFQLSLRIQNKPKEITEAIDLADAIEKTFLYPTDFLEMKIRDYHLKLPLVYTFSDLMEDFVNLVSDVNQKNFDEGQYGFSQNKCFDADWNFVYLENGVLSIQFDWRMAEGVLQVSSLPDKIEIKKSLFLNQWKKVFIKLLGYFDNIYLKDTVEMNIVSNLIADIEDS